MREWEKAFNTFDQAVEFFPDSADFYHNMGQVSATVEGRSYLSSLLLGCRASSNNVSLKFPRAPPTRTAAWHLCRARACMPTPTLPRLIVLVLPLLIVLVRQALQGLGRR